MKSLVILLALACGVAQLATGSTGIVGALLLGLHGRDHVHAVVPVVDGAHLDLLLAHHETADHDDAEPLGPELAHPSFPDGHHVLHLDTAEKATRDTTGAAAAPVLPPSVALPLPSSPRRVGHTALAPRARTIDQLRTVILRL